MGCPLLRTRRSFEVLLRGVWRVEVEVGLAQQLLGVAGAHADRHGAVGEGEAAGRVLGIDAMRHVVGQRVQQRVLEGLVRHGLPRLQLPTLPMPTPYRIGVSTSAAASETMRRSKRHGVCSDSPWPCDYLPPFDFNRGVIPMATTTLSNRATAAASNVQDQLALLGRILIA